MSTFYRVAVICAVMSHAQFALAEEPPTLPKCAEAFERAQRLSKQGKLTPALEQLLVCAQASCPPFLARECTATYDQIKTSIPTVTLIAKRSETEPLVDVKVSVDGRPLVTRIDGLSVPVDPGVHEFVFELEGEPPVTVRALLAEGEKNKPVVAEFRPLPAPAPAPAPPAPAPAAAPQTPEKSGFRVPTASYVLGGVGIVGLGFGITFRALGASDYNHLAETCGHNCSQGDVDAAKSKYLVSHIGFGVGAAALVASGVLLYFGQGDSSKRDGAALGIGAGPTLMSNGAPGAVVAGAF